LRAVKGGQASTDGMEQWAFIPQEFFPILKRQYDNSPPVLYPSTPSGLGATHRNYAWDGPITSYVKRDATTGAVTQALLFVSVRRGGRFIYAFDVTTVTAPKFLWRRGCVTSGSTTTCDTGYSEIGQTWSTPVVATIQATQANGHPVLIFGGGYDPTSEDAEPPATADTMGRAVYFVDATTGNVIWSVGKSNTTVTDSRLTFAFTADVLAIDRHQTGFIDRVYAADIGGNLWRIDTSGTSTSGWSIHNIASVGGRTATAAGRKFMFGADMVVTEAGTFDAVVIGSGDREHPLASSTDAAATTNRAYMFADPNVNTTGTDLNITESNLATVDTTSTTPVDLTGKQGWLVPLRTGEKVVNGPLVVASDMIFGTNQPCASGTVNASGDCDSSGTTQTCTGNLGIARRYDINFLTGVPSGFKDSSGNFIRSEVAAGGGFPPTPVAGEVNINGVPYTFITDNPLSPGGVITPTINVAKTRFRTYWHEILE
jgi:type IV pilus assembly protein PilY1